ncbi:MAG: hypothetical protein HC933_16125 [Pleurocapsa sp. SU_196_0]|nr:hypothetical protein [Pleurocapsa sp. SU_196_0]
MPQPNDLEPRAFMPTLKINPSVLIVSRKFSAVFKPKLYEASMIVLS